MQFSLYINQEKAVEWDLNLQQSILFSFLYSVPSWADPISINDEIYFFISKAKIAEELPILSGKADTIKRYFQQLEEAGLIDRFSTKSKSYFRLTSKAKEWNNDSNTAAQGREKNPDKVGKNIPTRSGKISPQGREKSPTYHITNNPNTNDHIKNTSCESVTDRFEKFYSEYPVKKSKAQALKVFTKLSPDDLLVQKITRSLRAQIENRVHLIASGAWVPEWKHPSTWLSQECWNDDLTLIAHQSLQANGGRDHEHATSNKAFAGRTGKLSTVDRQHQAAAAYLAGLESEFGSAADTSAVVASHE